MKRKFFRLAKCCYNCKSRKGRVYSEIYCTINKMLVNGRLICPLYGPTTNNNIIAAEKNLLPPKEPQITTLDKYRTKHDGAYFDT